MTSQVSSAKGSICKAEYAKPKLVSLVLYLNLESWAPALGSTAQGQDRKRDLNWQLVGIPRQPHLQKGRLSSVPVASHQQRIHALIGTAGRLLRQT